MNCQSNCKYRQTKGYLIKDIFCMVFFIMTLIYFASKSFAGFPIGNEVFFYNVEQTRFGIVWQVDTPSICTVNVFTGQDGSGRLVPGIDSIVIDSITNKSSVFQSRGIMKVEVSGLAEGTEYFVQTSSTDSTGTHLYPDLGNLLRVKTETIILVPPLWENGGLAVAVYDINGIKEDPTEKIINDIVVLVDVLGSNYPIKADDLEVGTDFSIYLVGFWTIMTRDAVGYSQYWNWEDDPNDHPLKIIILGGLTPDKGLGHKTINRTFFKEDVSSLPCLSVTGDDSINSCIGEPLEYINQIVLSPNNPPDFDLKSIYYVYQKVTLTIHLCASDPEGDQIAEFSLINAPEGMGIQFPDPNDNHCAIITWTPSAGGIFRDIQVTASDGRIQTSKTFMVAVLNGPPSKPEVSISPIPAFNTDNLICYVDANTILNPDPNDTIYLDYGWYKAGISVPILEELNTIGDYQSILNPSYTEIGGEYYCKVTARDKDGSAEPALTNSIIVMEAPLIKILYPNGNEIIKGNTQIEWETYEDANNLNVIAIDIFYSSDHGRTWNSISMNEENDGSYDWHINTLPDGEGYLVRLIYKVSGEIKGEDISDEVFSILKQNTLPQIQDIVVNQETDGRIKISYRCLDNDQSSVHMSFQYWNGTRWRSCYALTGGGMQPTNEPLTAFWGAKYDFQDRYLDHCQIRIIADDGQEIYNMASADSPLFVLDTKSPVTSAYPDWEIYDSPQTVILSATDDSDIYAIYYTTDSSDPTIESNLYTNPIIIEDNTSLKFFAVDTFGNQEPIRTEEYIIHRKVVISVTDPACPGEAMEIACQVQYGDGNDVDSDTIMFTISLHGSATFDPSAIEGEVMEINDIYNRTLVRTSGGRVVMIIRDDIAEDVFLSFEDTEGLGLEFPAFDYDFATSIQDIDYSSNTFTFPSTLPPSENGTLTVHAQGDLNADTEFFALYAESDSGTHLGDVFIYGGRECGSQITDSITISQSDLHNLASDGTITIVAKKSYDVNHQYCDKNFIMLNLNYKSFGSIPRFLDPNLDEDGDGLLNGLECSSGLNANSPDTDEDIMPDGYEYERGCLDPMDNGSADPNHGPNGDPDNDGVDNIAEYKWNTDPCIDDTDEDGISDGEEYGDDPISPKDHDNDGIINALDLDSDNDGLSDSEEHFKLGTDYTNPDTDGDGLNDQFEIGADPNHAALCYCNGILCPCVFDPNNNLIEYTLSAGQDKFFSDLTFHFEDNIKWQDGHYIMNGDIRIENGKILRIGEGVILKFTQRNSLLDLEGGNSGLVDLIIDGKLLIQGEPDNMVLLTPTNQSSCIFFDDMESGGSRWYADVPWDIVSTDSHSGNVTYCWTDSPFGDYDDNEDSWLKIRYPLDFSNIQAPFLHFWINYDIEFDYDYLFVAVALNNWDSWEIIEEYSGLSEGWVEETVDLIQYSGDPNVYIGFNFYSDDSFPFDGCYIDDIYICPGNSNNGTIPLPGDWGGLIMTSSSDPNSTIKHALIEYGRIGISVFNSSGNIYYSQIRNSLQAGIRLYNSNAIVKNNLITNNGKGIFLYSSDARIINNTFSGNGVVDQVDPNHPQILCHDSSPRIVNNIITNGGIGLTIKGASNPKVSYNDFNQSVNYYNCYEDIEHESTIIDPSLDPIPGGSQIYKDPMFQVVGQNNYRLQCPSPCIDAGDPNSDYSQEPEPNGDRINMGAYGGTPRAFHTDLIPPDPNDCSMSIKADSIHIDPDGIKYTNSPIVDLNISAYDECGISLMQLRNEDGNWSDPKVFASVYRNWEMNTKKADCNNPCKVYIRFSDARGNWSDPIYDTIVYDNQPPHICSVSIDEGALYTNLASVNLHIQAEDNCGDIPRLRISKDGQNWTPHQPFQSEFGWDLEDRSCSRQPVYVMISDRAGNKTVCTDTIQLDMDRPEGSVLINNGDQCTNSCTVTLDLSGYDTCSSVNLIGLIDYIDFDVQWHEVISPNNNIILEDWDLCMQDSLDGSRTVSVVFFDEAGNSSDIIDAHIELDREKADFWAFINYGEQETCSASVTLELATDSDDMVSLRLSNDPNWSVYQEIDFSEMISWNLCAYGGDSNQGEKTVYIKSYDNCGNESLTDAHISLTCTPPYSFTMDNSSEKSSTDIIYYKDNVIWEGYYNAYIITGDIVIEPFETLKITSDTQIMFTSLESNNNYRDTYSSYSQDCDFIVKGNLMVEGEEDKKVKFASLRQIAGEDPPSAGDWGGIVFYPSSSVKLEHTIIEYAINGIYILNNPSELNIDHCSLRNNKGAGLYCRLSSARITGFNISENYHGIFCDSSSPRIYNNTFSNNINAVYIDPHSDPNLSCNNQKPNQFLDSADIIAGRYAIFNNSGNQIAASHNKWGTNPPDIIPLLIYDKEDDPNKGVVDLYPIFGQRESKEPQPKKDKKSLYDSFYFLHNLYDGFYGGLGGLGGLGRLGGFYGLHEGLYGQRQSSMYQLSYPYTSYFSNWGVSPFPLQQQWTPWSALQPSNWGIPYQLQWGISNQSQWGMPYQSQWGVLQMQQYRYPLNPGF